MARRFKATGRRGRTEDRRGLQMGTKTRVRTGWFTHRTVISMTPQQFKSLDEPKPKGAEKTVLSVVFDERRGRPDRRKGNLDRRHKQRRAEDRR